MFRTTKGPVVLAALAVLAGPTLPAAAAAKTVPQVIVIGLDGLDPDLLDGKLKEGRLPNFARLIEGGYYSRYESEEPYRSPPIWTTVATGVPRGEHGIWDFVTGSKFWPPPLRKQKFRLLTSEDRQSRALWNYASDHHVQSAIINWMVTWPAEKIQGHVVAPFATLTNRKLETYKGRIRKNVEGQTYPKSLEDEITPIIIRPESITTDELHRLGAFPNAKHGLYDRVPKLDQFRYGAQWTLANTETNTRITLKLLKEHRPRLVMVYYDGPDTLGHRFWNFRRHPRVIAKRLEVLEADQAMAKPLSKRFGQVVDNYYEVLDGHIGRLMDGAEPGATFVVISDHGFGNYKDRTWKDMAIPYTGSHRKDGVFIIKGPGTQSYRPPEPVAIYDVAPTVLGLLGLPIPKELKGNALLQTRSTAISTVETKRNPRKKSRSAPASSFEDEEIERLRALGYVEN